MADAHRIRIVGIGEDGLEGLTAVARKLIADANLLVGDTSSLSRIPPGDAERLAVGSRLDEVVDRLRTVDVENVVVLAEGDPLFYGVARYLCDQLGKERFEVVPHVSSMQLAFARVKESWEEAFLTNLANHGITAVVEQIRVAEKVGLFTTEAHSPSAVAKALLERDIDYFTAYVCENLNSPDERVTQGELSELVDAQFHPLNVMILVRKPAVPDRPSEAIGLRLFGNPDKMFGQSQPKHELVTPAEVRVMALAEMDLGPRSTVWDVGAGSGSVAIEAAQIACEGTVYAIEQDVEDRELIVENAERFGVKNLVAVLGHAPEAYANLPDPDAVFVGGTGRGVGRLVTTAFERLRPGGRLVATMRSINNVSEIQQALTAEGVHVKLWMINLARGIYQMDRVRFEPLAPTFLVAVVKP
ncbi:MAG: precorrin-6y C5,15-methyltransferase (decarboxylating) subunit CbiE [Patescibacteria group bacterium]|nr:precorrin-6y C5,15-methyltransferase (decarboxylating) subunit CbiE [Patescibacteria group bacterium]